MAATAASQIREANPSKVPVIVQPLEPGAAALPRTKYLVDRVAPAAKLREALRADLKLPADARISLSIAAGGDTDRLPVWIELDYATTMQRLDEEHAGADGFLHVRVSVPAAAAAGGLGSSPVLAAALAAGEPPALAAGEPASGGGLVSPHGDRLPPGASISSCTFLNPRSGGKLLPALASPSNGGRVPTSLYIATLLDVTAVGLVVPLLAAYSRELGAGPRFTGVLQASYGLTQLVGANVLGGLSDTLGRRRMLQLSCVGGALGYTCLALSLRQRSLALLLLSRVPIGLLKQSLTVGRAIITDTTPVAKRMRPMARLGACVGTGFVFGPAFGGILSKRLGLQAPPLLAAALFATAQLVVSTCLPETASAPLAMSELVSLMRVARVKWEAAAATLPTSDVLPLPKALALCAALMPECKPNGKPIKEADADGLLAAWRDAITRRAMEGESLLSDLSSDLGNSDLSFGKPPPSVTDDCAIDWCAFRDELSQIYASHKVQSGELHEESLPRVLAAVATAGEPPPRSPSPPPRTPSYLQSLEGLAAAPAPAFASASAPAGAPAREAEPSGPLATLREVVSAARKLWGSASLPQVRRLLGARALVELSVMMTHAVFADYTRSKFGWDQRATGMGMAYSGALSVLVDILLLPLMHQRKLISELPAALGGACLVAAGLLSLSLGGTTKGFMGGLGLLSLGTSLFKSAMSTMVMGCARQDEAGTISGAMDAMEAVCRVAAPLGGGLLLEHVSVEGPPRLGALLALSGAYALFAVAPPAMKHAMLRPKPKPKAE